MGNRASSAAVFFLIFTAVSIIISIFSGLVWRNSVVVIIASLLVSYFLYKRLAPSIEVPRLVWVASLVVFILAVHPLLVLHPFYNASADPAPTIATQLITDKIPADHSPYTELHFAYQLGFPMFARLFVDFAPGAPWAVMWMLGAIFSALQVVFLYVFASSLLGSRRAGIASAFLLIGTKIVFQNMYLGEYTWIMGTTFFFAAFGMFFQGNRLSWLFFPVMLAVHPGVAFNAVLFLVFYTLFFRERFADSLKMVASSVLALPALVITYSVVIVNLFSGPSGGLDFSAFPSIYFPLPLWIGAVPLLAALALIGDGLWKRRFKKVELMLIVVFVVGVILFGVFRAGLSPVMYSKIVGIISISAVLLGAAWIGGLKISRRQFQAALCIVLILSLGTFFASGYLTEGRMGSKITPEEVEFSFAFKEWDPGLKRTIFLSSGSGKIAEYSNKIPYYLRSMHFISGAGHIVVKGEAWDKLIAQEYEYKKIFSEKCVECLEGIDVEYIVVNSEEFPMLEDHVFSYKNFYVYRTG